MNTPIAWSGRTTAYEHGNDHDWANCLPLPKTVAQGLRKVWWRPARQGEAFEIDNCPPSGPQGAEQVWYLDAQWSTCPVEVAKEVHELWGYYEQGHEEPHIEIDLGTLKDLHDEGRCRLPALLQWLAEQAPEMDAEDTLVIHWWW